MQEYQQILNELPIDQIAQQLGASPDQIRQAAANAVPALLMGLDANAQDPAGASSIANALGDHNPSLLEGGIDVGQIDTADGAKITHNIFGANEDAVVSQLGGAGGGGDLIKKLMPILAPIVMAWLANKLMKVDQGQGQPQATGAGGGGILGDILGKVLGGGQPQAQPEPQAPAGGDSPQFKVPDSGADDAGTPQMRMPEDQPRQQTQSAPDPGLGGLGGGILGDILGGLLGGGRR